MYTLSEGSADRNGMRGSDAWLWHISRTYARAYGWVKDRTGRNLKGLGRLLRRIESDREFDACGLRWFFDHRIAGTYMRLIAGGYNEPETHVFVQRIARTLNAPFTFIDVGANIGELVVGVASRPGAQRMIGFEPHPVCVEVCRRHIALNRLETTTEVRALVVGDGSSQAYVVDPKYAPTSGIRHDVPDAAVAPTARLDDHLDVSGHCVLLIDVEGNELAVMKGGLRFITTTRPLIIFEYHALTRESFSLDDVRAVLGGGYELFRLRADGGLDHELDDTYNCVAIPRNSIFTPLMPVSVNP